MLKLASKTMLFSFAIFVALACTIASIPPPTEHPPTPSSPTPTGAAEVQTATQVFLSQSELVQQIVLHTVTPYPTLIPPAVGTCTVSTHVLHVRACAGVDCAVIGWLYSGDVLTVTTSGDWLGVITPSSVTGWVNAEYCEVYP